MGLETVPPIVRFLPAIIGVGGGEGPQDRMNFGGSRCQRSPSLTLDILNRECYASAPRAETSLISLTARLTALRRGGRGSPAQGKLPAGRYHPD